MDEQNKPTDEQQDTPPEAKEKSQKAQPRLMPSDNPLTSWFIGMAFFVLSMGVLIWTASLTLGVMDIVLPNSPLVKYFSLALFDGGAFTWAGVYIYKAKGTPQRGMSLLMTVLDLMGVVAMVIGAVYLGGQNLTMIPQGMGQAMIYGVIAVTIANLAAGYYYHLNDPDNRIKASLQNFKDLVFEESLKQAEADVKANIRKHGAVMSLALLAQYKFDLGLPMTKAEKAALSEDVIDVQAIEIPELEAPAPRVLPAWWIALLRWLGTYKPVSVTNPSVPSQSDEGDSTDGTN